MPVNVARWAFKQKNSPTAHEHTECLPQIESHHRGFLCNFLLRAFVLSCQAHESLALICRLTVCQFPDSGVRLAVNRGWRGYSLHDPPWLLLLPPSSSPPASPSSFHPHMSAQVLTKPRIVGSLGTYGAGRQRNEVVGGAEGSGMGEKESGREKKLSGKCLSLSREPEECDGQMDNCYFRLPGRKAPSDLMRLAGRMAPTKRGAQIVASRATANCRLALPPSSFEHVAFILCGLPLCTQECSVYSVAEMLAVHERTGARAITQTQVNPPARPCRQSFTAMAAGSLCVSVRACMRACVCVRVVFGYSLVIGAAPSHVCPPVHIT